MAAAGGAGGITAYGTVRNYPTPVFFGSSIAALNLDDSAVQNARNQAETLLTQRLGTSEARLFEKTGKLARRSKLWPDIVYLIRRERRVWVVKSGRLLTELCVDAARGEPEADRIMSILDLVESDELRLWQMANITGSATGDFIPSDRDGGIEIVRCPIDGLATEATTPAASTVVAIIQAVVLAAMSVSMVAAAIVVIRELAYR